MPKLKLSRKEGESIIIDHDIIVTITRARNGTAKLVIDAPSDVDVIREELNHALEIEID